jgi:signal transduction histidine kinase
MVAEAKGKENALMASMLEKMYTQWKDSIANERAAAELKAVKAQYAEAQEDIDSKATKIAVQWGFIIVLIIIGVVLALALIFFVMLKFKNMLKIKKLNDSLEIANNNNERKSLFINNISEQINPSLDAIAQGDSKQVTALQNFMQHIKEYMVLENSREELYEQTDLSMERLCMDVVSEVRQSVSADLPIKMDAHGITFPSNEEALKQLLVALIAELAKSKETERISLEFKKRNPHTGNFIVSGIGYSMPEERRDIAFQAFAEVRNLAEDDGMLLPTCALIAYKLNGNLRLDDEFSQGTRFVVELHC